MQIVLPKSYHQAHDVLMMTITRQFGLPKYIMMLPGNKIVLRARAHSTFLYLKYLLLKKLHFNTFHSQQ